MGHDGTFALTEELITRTTAATNVPVENLVLVLTLKIVLVQYFAVNSCPGFNLIEFCYI